MKPWTSIHNKLVSLNQEYYSANPFHLQLTLFSNLNYRSIKELVIFEKYILPRIYAIIFIDFLKSKNLPNFSLEDLQGVLYKLPLIVRDNAELNQEKTTFFA